MCDENSNCGNEWNGEKDVRLQQAIANFMQPPYFNDICVCIVTTNLANGYRNEEKVLANKFLLTFFSLHLRELIFNGIYQIDRCGDVPGNIPTIELHLGTIANAGQAFRVILRYLYTGVLSFSTVHPFQVLQVSRICQIPMVEIQMAEIVKQFLSIQPIENGTLNTQHNTLFLNVASINERQYESVPVKSVVKETARSGAQSVELGINLAGTSPNGASSTEHFGNSERFNELILPSGDKEGWCRNKKYIEQVANGYMCTVCRKVYGRYNSVSYHVTIYHRNPPIKCDEKGCPFRTREARYIHFHKYYRHHIPLPDNIDLGSRKCPFCRHVSKSPAMLERHISRHVQDADRATSVATNQINDTLSMHFPICPQDISNYQCSNCNYRGRTSDSLKQHTLFAHSNEMFRRKHFVGISRSNSADDNNDCKASNQMLERSGKTLLVDAMRTAKRLAKMETAASSATNNSTVMQSEAICLVTPKA